MWPLLVHVSELGKSSSHLRYLGHFSFRTLSVTLAPFLLDEYLILLRFKFATSAILLLLQVVSRCWKTSHVLQVGGWGGQVHLAPTGLSSRALTALHSDILSCLITEASSGLSC